MNENNRHRFTASIYWHKKISASSKLYAWFSSFFFFFLYARHPYGLPTCTNITRETDKAEFRIYNWTDCGLFRGTNRSATNYHSNEWILTAASLTRNYRRNGKSFIAFEIFVFPFLFSLPLSFYILSLRSFVKVILCSSIHLMHFAFRIIHVFN